MNKKIKIIYIAGDARSGSTLLSSLLGEIKGIFNIGEAARYLFARFHPRDLPCGCKKNVANCSFWRDIVSIVPSEEVKSFAKKFMRIRNYPYMIFPFKSKNFRYQLDTLIQELELVYSMVVSKSACQIIVDSSKTPDFAWVLKRSPKLEVYIVHLIRDPRGVVYSWSKKKDYLYPQSLGRVSLGWLVTNLMVEYLKTKDGKYCQIYYEDLVQNPKEVIKKVLNFVGLKNRNLNFINDFYANLRPQHLLASNPDKLYASNRVFIKSKPWRISLIKRIFVLALTWPLFIKYYTLPILSLKQRNP